MLEAGQEDEFGARLRRAPRIRLLKLLPLGSTAHDRGFVKRLSETAWTDQWAA